MSAMDQYWGLLQKSECKRESGSAAEPPPSNPKAGWVEQSPGIGLEKIRFD
jgi:hypothetical protein